MKKIIITGVAGLLGSRMAEWILANQPNCTIIGIDDLSGGYQEYVPSGVDFHKLDLSKDTIAPLFEGADIVYHFAAYAAEGCLLYTSPSPRDRQKSRMPSSA